MFISLEKHCSFVQETCTRHTWRDLYSVNLWWFYMNSMLSCTWVSDRLIYLPEWFICCFFLACLRHHVIGQHHVIGPTSFQSFKIDTIKYFLCNNFLQVRDFFFFSKLNVSLNSDDFWLWDFSVYIYSYIYGILVSRKIKNYKISQNTKVVALWD